MIPVNSLVAAITCANVLPYINPCLFGTSKWTCPNDVYHKLYIMHLFNLIFQHIKSIGHFHLYRLHITGCKSCCYRSTCYHIFSTVQWQRGPLPAVRLQSLDVSTGAINHTSPAAGSLYQNSQTCVFWMEVVDIQWDRRWACADPSSNAS